MENTDREAGRLTLDTRKKVLLFAAIFLAAAFLLGCALCVFQLKTLDSGGKPCIVCIGDSLTFGSGVRETRDQDAWPAVLERELGGQYEVLNYGISGTVVQVGGDKPYDATMWEAAKKQHAEIYLFMLGSNDTKPQNWNRDGLAFQLGQMVKDLKKVPGVKTVYLMVPTPGYKLNEGDRYGIYNIDVDLINTELPPLFRECAEKNGVELIDLYSLCEGHPEYMVDGVHPNKEANQLIGEYIAQALRAHGDG